MKNILLTIILIISSVKANAQFLISAGAAGQEYSKDIDIDNQGISVVSQKVCKAESYSEILEPFRAQ
jgi:hypothetical protein